MSYVWQSKSWPELFWDKEIVLKMLGSIRYNQGMLTARLRDIGFDTACKAQLDVLVENAKNTAAIEGIMLDPEGIRSSAAKKLGLPTGGLREVSDQRIDGLVDILLDGTLNYQEELTVTRLQGWQASLFPTGYSGMQKITIGSWRKDIHGSMQVVSGRIGAEIVHFEAPPASILNDEMTGFLDWFNTSREIGDTLKAGLAHFKFVTIHPFSDGNGRIARVLTDMLLAREEEEPRRFYSVSSQIRKDRKQYYAVLEKMQKGSGDITEWMLWFLECLNSAMADSNRLLDKINLISRFWIRHSEINLNERQRKVVKKMLNTGIEGLEGGLNNRKYVGMAHTSRATAQRELADLVLKGILIRNPGGGRSVSYQLRF